MINKHNFFLRENLKIIWSKVYLDKSKKILIFSQIIGVLIGLISGKLIAEYFSPEQFGMYNLQFAIFTFLFSIIVSPVISFLKTSYHNSSLRNNIASILILLLFLSLFLAIILILFVRLYFDNFDIYFSFLILLLVPVFTFSSVISDNLNIHNRISDFSKFTIIKAASGLLLLLFFIIFNEEFDFTYLNLWEILFISSFISIIIYFKKDDFSFSYIDYNLSNVFSRIYKFSSPLILMAIFSWINNFLDRFIINSNLGLSEVGIYNANYSLGSKLFIMINPIFLTSITPFVYSNNSIESKKIFILKYSKIYIYVGVLILIPVFFLKDIIGFYFLSSSYSPGFPIIFWSALSFFLLTFSFLFESIFYSIHNTKVLLFSNVLSSIINLGLNLILIPSYGLFGASLALLFSVISKLVYTYKKFIHI